LSADGAAVTQNDETTVFGSNSGKNTKIKNFWEKLFFLLTEPLQYSKMIMKVNKAVEMFVAAR
jgi:hypothetical protein